MSRPKRLVAVCGTATDVGKTWVGVEVLRDASKSGALVSARKPVQSFGPGGGAHTDAHALADATGESPIEVCPAHRWYERAMAPPMAAEALAREPFSLAQLLAETTWVEGCDLGLLETIGGVRSPMADDGDCAGLVRLLSPDAVLLVADAGLGTINAVRLCLDALDHRRVVVYLNRFDSTSELHQRNRRWLVERDQHPVFTDPARVTAELLRESTE